MAIVAVSDGATALDTDLNQYNNHLTGVAGNTLAWFLRSTAASDFKLLLGDAAGARSFVIQDSAAAEVFAVDSNGIVSIGGTAITNATGQVKHEAGGLETDVSTVVIGDVLAGDGTGSIGLVAALGKSDGDVLTLQADGTLAYETPAPGVTDHGALTGLADDDHSQYHNDARAVTWHDADNHSSLAASELPTHGSRHERAGADEVNGDHLDIDFTPANYTPSTTPAEAANVNDLAAHLAGIDEALANMGLIAITNLQDWNGVAEYYTGTWNAEQSDTTANNYMDLENFGWNLNGTVNMSVVRTSDFDDPTSAVQTPLVAVTASGQLLAPSNIGGRVHETLKLITGKTYATIEIVFDFQWAGTTSSEDHGWGIINASSFGSSTPQAGEIAFFNGTTNYILYVNGVSNDTGVAKDTGWHRCHVIINIAAATVDFKLDNVEVVTAAALDTTASWGRAFYVGQSNLTGQHTMSVTAPTIIYKV